MFKSLVQKWKEKYPHGFVVYSGRMSSLGSSGATFIGHNSPRQKEVEHYRSTSGIGQARMNRENDGQDPPWML